MLMYILQIVLCYCLFSASLASETIAALGLEPRYHLRSRYAGLLPKSGSSDNNITEVRFFYFD